MTGLEPLHAAPQSQLDDAAAHIGQQRLTINALRDALKSALGYVEHWQADVACNLKPTVETLATAHDEISAAIKGAA
jgi:hypothetical protein